MNLGQNRRRGNSPPNQCGRTFSLAISIDMRRNPLPATGRCRASQLAIVRCVRALHVSPGARRRANLHCQAAVGHPLSPLIAAVMRLGPGGGANIPVPAGAAAHVSQACAARGGMMNFIGAATLTKGVIHAHASRCAALAVHRLVAAHAETSSSRPTATFESSRTRRPACSHRRSMARRLAGRESGRAAGRPSVIYAARSTCCSRSHGFARSPQYFICPGWETESGALHRLRLCDRAIPHAKATLLAASRRFVTSAPGSVFRRGADACDRRRAGCPPDA
jgi:hypothetical protein